MTVSTFYGTTNPASSGFTNPTYAQAAPNAQFATAGASANTVYTDRIGGFQTSGVTIANTIPSDATLNTVTLGYRYTITESRNAYHHGVTPMVSGSACGTEVYSIGESGATSGGGNGTTEDITGEVTDVTLAELRDANFQLEANINRTSGTRTYTYSLDSVWVVVDWSPAPIEYTRVSGTDFTENGIGLTDSNHTENKFTAYEVTPTAEPFGLTDANLAYVQGKSVTEALGLTDTDLTLAHGISVTPTTEALGMTDADLTVDHQEGQGGGPQGVWTRKHTIRIG